MKEILYNRSLSKKSRPSVCRKLSTNAHIEKSNNKIDIKALQSSSVLKCMFRPYRWYNVIALVHEAGSSGNSRTEPSDISFKNRVGEGIKPLSVKGKYHLRHTK